MSRNDFQRLFDQLDSFAIGFGPLFRDFQVPSVNYPPHNIIAVSDNELRLELAVAGFKKDEIKMSECQNVLTIVGDKNVGTDDSTYQYKGIAARSFARHFRMAEYYEVSGAVLEDGVLSVSFVKNVPETAKPRTIAIK